MRMPFSEFILNGDLKFIIAFILFTLFAFYHFFRKLQVRKGEANQALVEQHNLKINTASFWILILSVFSLLLGLMHSFYFIGKVGGIAPNIIFQGVSNALITPVLGISLFMLCKILSGVFNSKTAKI